MRRFESGWQKVLKKRKRDDAAKAGSRTLFEVGIKKKSRLDDEDSEHPLELEAELGNGNTLNEGATIGHTLEPASHSQSNSPRNSNAQPQSLDVNPERSSESSSEGNEESQHQILSPAPANSSTTIQQIQDSPNSKFLTLKANFLDHNPFHQSLWSTFVV